MPTLYDRKTGTPNYECNKAARTAFNKTKQELSDFTKDSKFPVPLRTEATKAIETIDAVLAKFPEPVQQEAATQ